MVNSLLYKACLLPAVLRRYAPFRRNSLYSWLSWHANDLTFFTLLGLPVVMLGLMFRFAYTDHLQVELEQQRYADLTCLARNIYFEARGEPTAGQYAVAEVTMNRVASKRFPGSVCAVVHEARWDWIRKRYVGAFSWTELDSVPRPKEVPWELATLVAVATYDNQENLKVPGALFYHADRISPSWSRTKKMVAQIGAHKFYE